MKVTPWNNKTSQWHPRADLQPATVQSMSSNDDGVTFVVVRQNGATMDVQLSADDLRNAMKLLEMAPTPSP